jgi:branched-chain amino acid transport system permease protein
MAAGLTLIFGVMEIINIAQGIFVVLAAYLSYVLQVHFGIDPFLGLLITMPLMFGVGLLVEWSFIRRLRPQNRSALSILVTFAVAIVIEGILTQFFSADLKTLTAWYVDRSWHVLGFYLPYVYLFGFGLAVVLLAALYLFLYRSRTGKSIRASVQNRTGAELIGININRVSAITFGVGAAVTAAGGMVFGATNTFNPNSGYDLISRLLVIIVLGGLGSIGGALVAAVVALVIEDVTAVLWSPVWASTMFFAVLVVVLLVRPNGLFGRQEARAQ